MAWHIACGVSFEPRTCIMHALMRWQDGESGVDEPRGWKVGWATDWRQTLCVLLRGSGSCACPVPAE